MLRLRSQLENTPSTGVSNSTVLPRVQQSLLQAEEALRSYAVQWEAKQQLMQNVKSKLMKRRMTSFGTADMSPEQLSSTPYLVSLSSDPQMNLAFKVYLPYGNNLRIGRYISEEDTAVTGDPPDLQLQGVGITRNHCMFRSYEASSIVTITSERDSITYINGRQLITSFESQSEEVALHSGDRVVLGACSHVFVFVNPGEEVGNMPTHELAIREVIIGRSETSQEKSLRLAAMVSICRITKTFTFHLILYL